MLSILGQKLQVLESLSNKPKADGLDVKIGKFPFSANGRAKCMNETEGFVKIIADKRTDTMLGAHIVGPSASELIAEIAVGFEYKASAEDIARSVHAHPTLAETVKEAALAVDKFKFTVSTQSEGNL